VLVQRVLGHDDVGPDGVEQLFLGDEVAARAHQNAQQLERGAADGDRGGGGLVMEG